MPDVSFFKNVFSLTDTRNYAADVLEFTQVKMDLSAAQSFNHQNPNDIKLLVNANTFLIKKRNILQNLDQHIIGGLAIGIAASVASFILPLSLLATGCYIYSIYCLGSRMQAQLEYHSALENMMECKNWSLKGADRSILEIAAIKNMIATLALPTTNEELCKDVRLDTNEKEEVCRLADAAENESMLNLFGRQLNGEQTSAYRNIYGYQKGSLVDASMAIYYFACEGFNWTKNKIMSQTTPQSQPAAIQR